MSTNENNKCNKDTSAIKIQVQKRYKYKKIHAQKDTSTKKIQVQKRYKHKKDTSTKKIQVKKVTSTKTIQVQKKTYHAAAIHIKLIHFSLFSWQMKLFI